MSLLPFVLVLISTGTHAAWNLLTHRQSDSRTLFLRISLVIGIAGLLPAGLHWSGSPTWPGRVWGYLALTGLFQASYMFALIRGYRLGDFTVVYPVARALPVLILAVIDIARGHAPALLGWLGMISIVVGCVFVPLESLRPHWRQYWNRTSLWIGVVAFSTVGYTIVDKLAQDALTGLRPPDASGVSDAATYGVFQALAAVPFLWIGMVCFDRSPPEGGRGASWPRTMAAAALVFVSYGLVLWAYQLTDHTSYVVGLRQFSIVIGVVLGSWLNREPAARLRITASILITVGVVCLAFG